jgi:integrase
MAGVG